MTTKSSGTSQQMRVIVQLPTFLKQRHMPYTMRRSQDTILVQKPLKDNQKIARTRRQRGYHWEDTIVKRFNGISDWKAFRLGSPSTALPDVLAVSTHSSALFAIEAKSGTSTSLAVPFDQIERCMAWADTFEAYKKRKVVLAFKFLAKKRIGLGKYESRKLREYFKEWNPNIAPTDCACTYDGKTYIRKNGQRKDIKLKDCKMPFNTNGMYNGEKINTK